MLTSTTTTCVRFVEENRHPYFNDRQMYRAYLACRKTKRNKPSALQFEIDFEQNLISLTDELLARRYEPTTSICFYTEKPKHREIFAAAFRDRVVHHLIYSHIAPTWEKIFIDHSYACRPDKGAHAAVVALQQFLRKATANGARRAFYLKLDIRNFFMSIDKRILLKMLEKHCRNSDLLRLLETVVFHDPTTDYISGLCRFVWVVALHYLLPQS